VAFFETIGPDKKATEIKRHREKSYPSLRLRVSVADLLRVLRTLRVETYQENRNITCVSRMNPPWETIVPKAELPWVVFI